MNARKEVAMSGGLMAAAILALCTVLAGCTPGNLPQPISPPPGTDIKVPAVHPRPTLETTIPVPSEPGSGQLVTANTCVVGASSAGTYTWDPMKQGNQVDVPAWVLTREPIVARHTSTWYARFDVPRLHGQYFASLADGSCHMFQIESSTVIYGGSLVTRLAVYVPPGYTPRWATLFQLAAASAPQTTV